MGAAREWLQQEYGGLLLEFEATVATAAAAAEVTKNDPDALALLFVNFGAFDIFLTLAQNPAGSSGIRLGANGGSVSLNVRDDMSLPTRSWFASSPGGASSLYVLRMRREAPTE